MSSKQQVANKMFAPVVFQELGVSCVYLEMSWLRLDRTLYPPTAHARVSAQWRFDVRGLKLHPRMVLSAYMMQRPGASLRLRRATITAPFSNHLPPRSPCLPRSPRPPRRGPPCGFIPYPKIPPSSASLARLLWDFLAFHRLAALWISSLCHRPRHFSICLAQRRAKWTSSFTEKLENF